MSKRQKRNAILLRFVLVYVEFVVFAVAVFYLEILLSRGCFKVIILKNSSFHMSKQHNSYSLNCINHNVLADRDQTQIKHKQPLRKSQWSNYCLSMFQLSIKGIFWNRVIPRLICQSSVSNRDMYPDKLWFHVWLYWSPNDKYLMFAGQDLDITLSKQTWLSHD